VERKKHPIDQRQSNNKTVTIFDMNKVFSFCLFLFLFLCFSANSQSLLTFQVSSNYNTQTSAFDKKKVLNVARGGQGISGDLNWMPKYYDKLVEIGIDEFRVDWLLSNRFYNVVTRNSSGVLQYNFANLDKTILPMAQKGIKPLMCMTFMATPLGRDSFPPSNYDEYGAVIRAYVQYYKNKGYTGWAWESHNEPEGFTKLTSAQVYAMYEVFATTVKSVDPTARVGGFGSVGVDWINFLKSFLAYYKADTSKPAMDFFSFHQYGKESWDDVPSIENAFTSIGLTVPNLYITEWNNHWGTSPGQGNYGISGVGNSFDTNVNATYIAKKMFNLFSYNNVKKIYYFNFADTDASKKYSGDMGIFTADSYHRKAGANTFLMFNRMYDQYLPSSVVGAYSSVKNTYGFITVDKVNQKAAIILWNYQNSAVISKSIIQNMPALPEGWTYRADMYQIDSMNGNQYYDFKKGWFYSSKSANEDIKIMKSYKLNAGMLTIIDTLPKYSVVQYLITPENNTGTKVPTKNDATLKVVPGIFSSSFNGLYNLRTPGNVKLEIIDCQGKQMMINEEGYKESMLDHEFHIHTNNWQSGVYFLVLILNGRKVNSLELLKK
jgi:hypothetical protein